MVVSCRRRDIRGTRRSRSPRVRYRACLFDQQGSCPRPDRFEHERQRLPAAGPAPIREIILVEEAPAMVLPVAARPSPVTSYALA